jgi:hypothetical protein
MTACITPPQVTCFAGQVVTTEICVRNAGAPQRVKRLVTLDAACGIVSTVYQDMAGGAYTGSTVEEDCGKFVETMAAPVTISGVPVASFTNYQASNSGAGYALGDQIRNITVYSSTGALLSSSWINMSAGGTVIPTPASANISPLSTVEFTGTVQEFVATVASPGIAKYDIIQRTLLRSGAATNTMWDNLTQNTVNVAAPATGTYDVWDAAKLDSDPVIGYQNLSSAIGLAYPLAVPSGAMRANVMIEGGQIRLRTDGVAATATTGQRWAAGAIFSVYLKNVSQMSIFALTAGSISIEYVS